MARTRQRREMNQRSSGGLRKNTVSTEIHRRWSSFCKSNPQEIRSMWRSRTGPGFARQDRNGPRPMTTALTLAKTLALTRYAMATDSIDGRKTYGWRLKTEYF